MERMMSLTRLLARATPSGLPVARGVVRAGLGRAFGPPPFDVTAGAGDEGLFGPGSVSWGIVSEPAAIVGGIRSLLVQALHPLAVAGVVQHSRYRDDPLGRLRRTSAYVTATTFGSTTQALAAARAVRGVHRRVTGTAPDGRPYRAADPRLLAWVSMSFTSSLLATDRAYAPEPARGPAADAFVEEQSRAAALLDPRVDLDRVAAAGGPGLQAGEVPLPLLDDGVLPRTVAELDAAAASFRGELAVGEQGRDTLRFLLWPPVPAALLAGYLPLLAGAIATLEPGERELLGLPRSGVVAYPVTVQTRSLLVMLRLACGRSPSLEAATRRAAAPRLAA
jgi:hypothetical protein